MSIFLPRLPPLAPSSGEMQIWWQQVVEAVERHEEAQDIALADLQQVQTDLAAAIADIQLAMDTANARMDDLAPVMITADYTGAVDPSDQLPYQVSAKRYDGATNVTTSASWSRHVDSGSITCTIGAATGILNITAVGSSGVVSITSTHNSIALTKKLTVTKTIAAAPSTGSGGAGTTTSTDTSFLSINSTTHAAISDELTVTVGSSGTVDLSATLTVRTAKSAPETSYNVYGKWQWWNGASWADVAAEVASNPDCTVSADPDSGIYLIDPGTLTVNTSKTGLAAASSQKFRVMARNASGTRVMTFSGTASAVP